MVVERPGGLGKMVQIQQQTEEGHGMHLKVSLVALAAALAGSAALAEGLTDACASALAGQRLAYIVPADAGGGYDTYARSMAPVIERLAGMTVQVSNVSAAGGSVGQVQARNAPPGDYTLFIENLTQLTIQTMYYQADQGLTGFQTLAVVDSSPEAWVALPDFDLSALAGKTIVASQGTLDGAIIPIGMTATLLGAEADYITGYDGSSDFGAAVLRGETDMTSVSLASALRLSSGGDLKVALLISDHPSPLAPDAPYLAGEGGIVDQLTSDADEATRTAAMALAQSIADIPDARGVFAPSAMEPEKLACLTELVDAVVLDPEFSDLVIAQGRTLDIQTSQHAALQAEKISAALAVTRPMYEAMLAAARD